MTTATPGSSGGGTKEQAKHAADSAQGEAQRVTDVAKGEASNVAGEAKEQAKNLAGELRSQVEEQTRTGKDRLTNLLQELGDELEQMASASESSGMASQVARQAAERSHQMSSFMENREAGDLVHEVRRFAARRPGSFLLGALAAGVVAGRLTRGVASAHSDDSDGTSASRPATGRTGTEASITLPPTGGTTTGTTGTTGTVPAGGYGGPVPTGPAVDPVEPGYPAPGTTRPGGIAQ